MQPVADLLPGWRSALGVSTKLWVGSGRHEVEPGRWVAFSGAKTVDYNAILCHGPDGARDLARSLEDVQAAKVPAVIMVAGPALGLTNVLANASWVCVGARPFMAMRDIRGDADADARPLLPPELPLAHAMLSAAFDVSLRFAEIALPTVAADAPKRTAWGLFDGGELVSCVAVVTVDNTIAIWSMATPPDRQRHGYGRRLLSAVRAAASDAGATTALLFSSPDGQRLYQSAGFEIVEYWQAWSRARWVFPPV